MYWSEILRNMRNVVGLHSLWDVSVDLVLNFQLFTQFMGHVGRSGACLTSIYLHSVWDMSVDLVLVSCLHSLQCKQLKVKHVWRKYVFYFYINLLYLVFLSRVTQLFFKCPCAYCNCLYLYTLYIHVKVGGGRSPTSWYLVSVCVHVLV